MIRSILLASLLLFCTLRVLAAEAVAPCPASASSWHCLGAVEMRVGERTFRMSRYANDEMLAEIEEKAGSKRYLVAQPSGSELYLGLSPQEISDPAANPFAFFDYAFALPVAAVRLAFPNGPISVPASTVKRDVVVEGNRVAVRASRPSGGLITYQVESAAGVISGQIIPRLLQPLEGGYSLAGWQRKIGPPVNSLTEARLVPRQ